MNRLRALLRFRRARSESTSHGVFTARSSPGTPTLGTRVPERIIPSAAPRVTVHQARLDRPTGRVELTPSQAIELARQGPAALRRKRPEAG